MPGFNTRLKRRWVRVLGPIVVTVAGILWMLSTPQAGERVCAVARAQLPHLLGGPVELQRCEIHPFTGSVALHGVTVHTTKDGPPLFSVDTLEVSLSGYDPFTNTVELGRVRVRRPHVRLDLSHPPPPGSVPQGPPVCAAEILQRIGANRLDIQNAELELLLPDQRRVELTGLDVDWRTRRDQVDLRVQARNGVVDLGPRQASFALTKLAIAGTLHPAQEKLDLSNAEVGLEGFNVTLRGQLDNLCDPTLQMDAQLFVPVRGLAKAVGMTRESRGQLLVRASVSGKPQAPFVRAELVGTDVAWDAGEAGNFQVGNFRARLSANLASADREVQIHDVDVPTGAGRVHISGKLKLSGNLPLELAVNADRADFAAALEKAGLTGAWVNFATSGKGSLRGQLVPFRLHGEADMKGERFILAAQSWRLPYSKAKTILQFPEGHILTGVELFPDRVEFTHARVSTPSDASIAQGSVTLYFDPLRGLRIQGSMPTVDLSEFKELAGFRMAGKGNIGFQIGGPMKDIQIETSLALHDLLFWDYALGTANGPLRFARGVLSFPAISAQKGKTAYSGTLSVDFNPRDLYVKAHAEIPQGRAEDVIDLLAPLSDLVTVFQGELTGGASGSIDIDSPVSTLTGKMEVDLDGLRYYGRRLGSGELRFRFVDGERLTLDRAEFQGPVGKIDASGDYGFQGDLRYRFHAEPFTLAELVGPERAQKLGIQGRMVLDGQVAGTSDVPQVSATLQAPRVTFADKDLGKTQLEMRLLGRELRLSGSPFRDARVELRMKLKEPYPYATDLDLTLPEIRPLLPQVSFVQGLSGQISAKLHVSGDVQGPGGGSGPINATADVGRLSLARGEFRVSNDGPLLLHYANGQLSAEPFRLVGPNTELSGSGTLGKNGLDARVRGGLDLRVLQSLTSSLERTSGTLDFNASVRGNVSAPLLVGSARLSRLELAVRGQDVHVRDLSGQVSFSDSRLIVEELEGVLNEGRLQLSGDVTLNRFSLKRLGLHAHLDGISLRPLKDLPLTASGDLSLTGGAGQKTKLSGDVVVDHLHYEQPIVIESFLQRILAPRALGGGQAAREWLTLDVGVKLADATLNNNLARMRVFGSLRVVGTNLEPTLQGTLEAGGGGLAYFRGNRFDVTQGLMEFKPQNGMDAVFDVHALSQVQEYTVRLHAFGKTSDPKVLLTAEPPLSEADILSLLTLGITSRDRGTSTAGTGAGLAAEALLSATGLDRQVERFLPKNAVLRDLSLRVATLYNGATGLVEPTPQLESKLLTEQLKIRIAQPVSGRGTRAQAEYQFTDRLSAQAQWDNENVDYSYGNLGLDLKLRWDVN